jgi:hypothetical protein
VVADLVLDRQSFFLVSIRPKEIDQRESLAIRAAIN